MLPPQRGKKVSGSYPKDLAAWLQRDYFRRRGGLRRYRGLLGLAVAIGCALLALVVPFWPGGRRAFQAAPVSEAHALFNDRCTVCHTTTFTTAARLVRGDEVRSVSDEACKRCHDGPLHHKRQVGTTACASCHREHRGTGPIARVDDRRCTDCHAHLASHTDRTEEGESVRVFRDVTGFIGRSHPPLDAWEGKSDPGTIRFSHRVHLKPEGVPLVGRRGRRVLTCVDCHRPDQERRYMQLVDYQHDCAGCHPLTIGIDAKLSGERARREAERFEVTPLPHPALGEEARAVRAEVRERLIRFVQGNPAVLGERVAAGPDRLIPGRDRLKPPRVTGVEWKWVGYQLERMEHTLFDGAGGCRFCHEEISEPTKRIEGLPRYASPALNARWFPHSIFSHDSHRALDCQQCHVGTGSSESSKQILMPGIQTCQRCHGTTTGGARSDCVACHAYHDRREESRTNPGLTVGEALTAEPNDAAVGGQRRSRPDDPNVPRPEP